MIHVNPGGGREVRGDDLSPLCFINIKFNLISPYKSKPTFLMDSHMGNYSSFVFLLLLSFLVWDCSGDNLHNFLHCVSPHSSQLDDSNSTFIYTPSSPSYSSVLNFTIRNLRFSGPNIPKPIAIIKPSQPSQVQTALICCKKHGIHIRIRSGGHDFEGLSYVANLPFLLIDLANLNAVTVEDDNTAWVQSGASMGELYYKLSQQTSSFGFPGGVQPNVGVGGFFSGGGYGLMVRKYGLGVDNVVDAQLVDANGDLLDRKSMGEDLFWAIRGGGGGSFGIVLAWKLKLVPVPAIVTSFTAFRSWGPNSTKLVHRWQYVAPEIDHRLFIGIMVTGLYIFLLFHFNIKLHVKFNTLFHNYLGLIP